MIVENLTPHRVTIYNAHPKDGGYVIAVVDPSGMVARIKTEVSDLGKTGRIPLFTTNVTGEPVVVDGAGKEHQFPDERNSYIYIVSSQFRQFFKRHDVYQPGELVRDTDGVIIGCVGLSQ